MNSELQKKLFDKYPKLFAERHLPMTQTCMCWGIECGDGWYDLLDRLCAKLDAIAKEDGLEDDLRAVQVKEKFGGLRFYTNGGNDKIDAVIAEAQNESEHTCEICGKPGEQNRTGWISIRCSEHSDT